MHPYSASNTGSSGEGRPAYAPGGPADPMAAINLPQLSSRQRSMQSMTAAQAESEYLRRAVVRACQATLLGDAREINSSLLQLKVAESGTALRPHQIRTGRLLVENAQKLSRMGHLVAQGRYNASDGSLCTLTNSCADPTEATERAVQAVVDLHDGAAHMKDRTWILHLGRSEFDPGSPDTGLKLFDDQARRSQGLMTGNVHSNVQTSQIIRPHTLTHCNGRDREPGQLRAFDLQTFQRQSPVAGDVIPLKITRAIDANPDLAMDLYKVFHTRSTGARYVHGWVLTESQTGSLISDVDANDGGWNPSFSQHTCSIMRRAKAAFTMELLPNSRVPLVHIEQGRVLYAHPVVLAQATDRILQACRQSQTELGSDDDNQAIYRDRPAG